MLCGGRLKKKTILQKKEKEKKNDVTKKIKRKKQIIGVQNSSVIAFCLYLYLKKTLLDVDLLQFSIGQITFLFLQTLSNVRLIVINYSC